MLKHFKKKKSFNIKIVLFFIMNELQMNQVHYGEKIEVTVTYMKYYYKISNHILALLTLMSNISR